MLKGNISPAIHFLMKNETVNSFKLFRAYGEEKPSINECKGELKGIELSYAFCGEQDYGIHLLAKAFDAMNNDLIIKEVPLKIIESKGVKAIMYGEDAKLDRNIIHKAKKAGAIGYWDKANLLICVASEYSFLIDSIKEMMVPEHVKFGFKGIFGGRYHLLILAT